RDATANGGDFRNWLHGSAVITWLRHYQRLVLVREGADRFRDATALLNVPAVVCSFPDYVGRYDPFSGRQFSELELAFGIAPGVPHDCPSTRIGRLRDVRPVPGSVEHFLGVGA